MPSAYLAESGRSASILDAIARARQETARAPFLWISQLHRRRVVGKHSHHETADGGHSELSWHWDGEQLVIRSDDFGFIPAFVYCGEGEIAVSTSIDRLVEASDALHIDEAALAVFLRLGFFVGDDTPFREIRALPPAAHLKWQAGQLRASGGPYVVRATAMSRADAIPRALELTARAVQRRHPTTEFAVPLSGGRDSRHILLALAAQGAVPTFVVTVPRLPPAPAEDTRVAALLAAHLQVRSVVVPHADNPAAAEARKNVITHYCADEHAWFLPMIDYVREHVPLAYEGIGGSLWTTGWLPDRESREAWRYGRTRVVARRMLDAYGTVGERFLADLLGQNSCTRGMAEARLSTELERHVDAPDPGKSFHFWNRLRRELALIPYGLLRRGGDVHTPLVDRELVDFLLSLAPEVMSPELSRADTSFHTMALHHAFPASAHVPFEREDAPHTDARDHARRLTSSVARHLLSLRRRRGLMRTSYVLPRAAYTLVNGRYAESSGWLATSSLYLSQLEDAVS